MDGLSIQTAFVGMIQPEVSLKAQMNAAIAAQPEIYDDDVSNYTIIPSWQTDIILPTKDKLMKENLTVEKIAQYAVSNDAGGVTLILGGQ